MGLLDYNGDLSGLLGGISNFAGNNSNALIGLGAGIASGANGGGWGQGVQAGLQGFIGGRESDQKLRIQQASLNALVQQGLTPQQAMLAINNPEFMKAAAPSIFPKYDFQNVDNTVGRFNPATGRFDVQGAVPKETKLSAGETLVSGTPPGIPPIAGGNLSGAPRMGAPMGPPMAPQMPPQMPQGSTAPIVPNSVPTLSIPPSPGMAGNYTPVASGGPPKPPENYTWNNPGNPAAGATRIPGTQPPPTSDEAGKLAMIEASKQGVEQAKQFFLSPDFKSGVVDTVLTAGKEKLGVGDISRHQRAVEMGTEAALRIATGANAPISEVKKYADFYMPSVYDSVETRTQKLSALQRFMDYAEQNMSTGRLVPLKQMPPPAAFMPGVTLPSGKEQARVSAPAWPPPPSGFTLVQ